MKRKRETGQALVEFALVLTVLFMLLLGIFEFGRVFLEYVGLSYAMGNIAQAAARLGGADPAIQTVLERHALPPLVVKRIELTWAIADPDGTVRCTGATCRCDYGQVVQLTGHYPTQVQILGFRAQMQLRVEQAVFCWRGGMP